MGKIFNIIIEVLAWLGIFISPVLLFGVVAIFIYFSNKSNEWLAIVFLAAGVVLGALWAERIRKKYGCSAYLGGLSATPDFYPNELDNIIKKEDEEKENKGPVLPGK